MMITCRYASTFPPFLFTAKGKQSTLPLCFVSLRRALYIQSLQLKIKTSTRRAVRSPRSIQTGPHWMKRAGPGAPARARAARELRRVRLAHELRAGELRERGDAGRILHRSEPGRASFIQSSEATRAGRHLCAALDLCALTSCASAGRNNPRLNSPDGFLIREGKRAAHLIY